MNQWELNHPEELREFIPIYENIQREFNEEQKNSGSEKRVSIADLIVLGGCAAIETAAKKSGFDVKVPFTPCRVDAIQEDIEIEFYRTIEPFADGFRNYFKDIGNFDESDVYTTPEYFLIDKAELLTLTVPELTVLVGGLRVLGATYQYSNYGVLTGTPGTLTNDFFVNLLDMEIEWKSVDDNHYLFDGYNRRTGEKIWTATRVDLIFGHHDELRAVAEVYASNYSKEKFVHDFIASWNKVMILDRFS